MKAIPGSLRLFKIPLMYLIMGMLWILAGNELLHSFTVHLSEGEKLIYQGWKGTIYVLTTTVMLSLLIKKQQKKLLSSEKQYRSFFSGNPSPMFVFSIKTRKFIEVNKAAILNYGYSKSEFLNMSIQDIGAEESWQKSDMTIREQAEPYRPCVHRKKSGEEFFVSINSHKVNFNDQECILILALDIHEKIANESKLINAYCTEKELNRALENNTKKLKVAFKENRLQGEILSKINNMVIVLDRNGIIKWVNNAFIEFTGFTLEEVKGKKPPEVLFGPKTDLSVIDELNKTIHEKKFFNAEIINYRKNKEPYWVQLNISPLLDEYGNLEGIVSIENVVTEKKEKEERITAQNRAFREIAWISSHRLRRPVASIYSLTDLLNEEVDEQEKLEYIHLLKISSMELDEVVREVTSKINQIESVYT